LDPAGKAVVFNDETVWYAVKKLSHKFRVIVNPFVSWIGFAPDPTVDFEDEHCDKFDSGDDDRLCWMMDHVSGGYRAGKHVDLEFSKKWYKVLYYANHSMDYYTACNYKTTEIILNDVDKLSVSAKLGHGENMFASAISSSHLLLPLALSGIIISLFALLYCKFKGKMSPKRAYQWIALNPTVSQLVSEEYKPLIVTEQT